MSSTKNNELSFAERIRRIREDAGLNQAEFAARIGVKPPYISMLERGKNPPSSHLLLGICRAFGVRVEWLKDGEGAVYEASYSRTLDDPVVRAIIRKLGGPRPPSHGLSPDDRAMVFGVDRRHPEQELPLPPEYWDAIAWINRIFRENDQRWIGALQSLMRAWLPAADRAAEAPEPYGKRR